MAKFTRVTKLIAADGVTRLRIYAHSGKSGFNLGATLRSPGQKAQTGAQASVETLAEAESAFTKMVDEAVKRGWTVRVTNTGIGNRSRFTEIPDAPAAKKPVIKDEAPAPAEQAPTSTEQAPAEPEPVGAGATPAPVNINSGRKNRK